MIVFNTRCVIAMNDRHDRASESGFIFTKIWNHIRVVTRRRRKKVDSDDVLLCRELSKCSSTPGPQNCPTTPHGSFVVRQLHAV